MENLLVICLPDHGFYYPEEGLVHDPRIHHIPMLWLGGAIKQPMVIDKLMNQSDMAATLLAQLGISHKEFNFSRNVLGKDYNYPFAYYTYNNGFAFRDSTGTTLIDNNSGKALIESPAPNERRTELGKRFYNLLMTIWERDKFYSTNITFDASRGLAAGDSSGYPKAMQYNNS